MNKIKLLVLLLAATMLWSCDSNKGKAKEITEQFIAAVNAKDKASIYDLYPNAKNITNMTLPDSIEVGDLSVEKTDAGLYIVSIENARKQKLEFKAEGKDKEKLVLIDSYSVLQLDSASTELGIKTGVPLKTLADTKLATLFNVDSAYVQFLNEKYADAVNGNLTYESGTWSATRNWGGSVSCTQPIRNVGDAPISGDEYNVEFYFYCPNGSAASEKIVVPGVDLQPGEATSLYPSPGSGYVNACMNHDFNWNVTFVYKNQTPIDALLKYAKFNGKEYEEFAKEQSKKQEAGKDNDYAWLSERSATEDDVAGMSKADIRIMRNAIYAMHGYIFKSDDLKEYFGKQSWYKAEKADVTAELSDVEKANVEFLKKHE